MRALASIAAMLALGALPARAAGLEGIWRGAMGTGYVTGTVELAVVDDIYRLRFLAPLPKPLEDCAYIGRIAAGPPKLLRDNRHKLCDTAPKVELSRANANALRLVFAAGTRTPLDVRLDGVARETEPPDMPASPKTFDTLGARPGMTPAQLRQVMQQQNAAEQTAHGPTLVFAQPDGDDVVMGIFEGTVAEDSPAVAILRQFKVPDGKRLTIDEMDAAMAGKYGPPSLLRFAHRQWFFDHEGRIMPPEKARSGDHGCLGRSAEQPKTVVLDRARLTIGIVPGCGSRLNVHYVTDSGNRIERVRIELIDSATALNAAWAGQRALLARQLADDFTSVNTVRQAPKL